MAHAGWEPPGGRADGRPSDPSAQRRHAPAFRVHGGGRVRDFAGAGAGLLIPRTRSKRRRRPAADGHAIAGSR